MRKKILEWSGMEYKMENFLYEMEEILQMKYGKIVFHSIACPAWQTTIIVQRMKNFGIIIASLRSLIITEKSQN